jgi:quercetin dioxygenase-like cupin family protein
MSFGPPSGHNRVSASLNGGRLSFLGRRLAPGFVVRVLVVAPGARRPYDDADWRGAIVVVESGAIVLEPRAGRPYRFGPGDVLWLQGLPLRALHNLGSEPAVLVAVVRCRDLSAVRP